MTEPLVVLIVVFVLAMFVGFEVITKVPPTLHTPLMSASNAISGITLIGALLIGLIADRTGSIQAGFYFTAVAMCLSGLWVLIAAEETHPGH